MVKQVLHYKLDVMSYKFISEDVFDDTLSNQVARTHLQNYFIKFDMADIFNIVYIDANDEMTLVEQKNLFTEYESITPKHVGQSTHWIHGFFMGDLLQTVKWESTPVTWVLQNNMSPTLYEKCLESEELFPVEQWGGPLLYSILQAKLESSTEMAAKHLLSKVEELDIKSYDGENIPPRSWVTSVLQHTGCVK